MKMMKKRITRHLMRLLEQELHVFINTLIIYDETGAYQCKVTMYFPKTEQELKLQSRDPEYTWKRLDGHLNSRLVVGDALVVLNQNNPVDGVLYRNEYIDLKAFWMRISKQFNVKIIRMDENTIVLKNKD